MVRRMVGRFMALAALAAVTLGVLLIVHSTLDQHSHAANHPPTAIVNGRRRPAPGRRGPKYYRVKTGDTLSSIADKTGVSMTTLTALNPSLASSPNSLQTGQRLRLRH